MSEYRYTECGLDNVIIEGMKPTVDDDGDEVISIPYVAALHRAIAEGIIRHRKGMSGAELRFLRTEMGMTQAELARLVHRERLTLGRWERGEIELDGTAEALIRLKAAEALGIELNERVDQLSEWCVPSAETQSIIIETVPDDGYRMKAA